MCQLQGTGEWRLMVPCDGNYLPAWRLGIANEVYVDCATNGCIYGVLNGVLAGFSYDDSNNCWQAYPDGGDTCWESDNSYVTGDPSPLVKKLEQFCFHAPTTNPTPGPSPDPTPMPSEGPTTLEPTSYPTESPTTLPTDAPTGLPSVEPTFAPTSNTTDERPLPPDDADPFEAVGGIVGLIILAAGIVFCVCFWWMCHSYKSGREVEIYKA